MRPLLPPLLAALALALPVAAHAQWQWLDKDGRKVFSDRAPPPDIPPRNILRQPGQRPTTDGAPAPAPAAAAAPLAVPKPTGRDPALEEKRKQAEAEALAKKRAEEQQLAVARAENCERAKTAKATLASGVRIAQVNAKGEREFMSDQARAAELRRLDEVIAKDCGS